jgi:hypothetical protein
MIDHHLPAIPPTFGLGIVAVGTMYAILPAADRVGYLFGILTLGVLLVLAELTVGHQRRTGPLEGEPDPVNRVVRDATILGIGVLRRNRSGELERIDPARYGVELIPYDRAGPSRDQAQEKRP